MRLKKIKLAGFKSFVDPTILELRSQLLAVVGPNGCGKSNVIDAVRWVMGESSIKKLRGESQADVIFSGSSARKPVGQASVELVFDNTDGSLGGEYSSYSEISVKRLATREGDSNYFLNGSRCRRRDITEIFMGTGLGPRSYSIIEQGMISRLIEAKPEDLRAFVEEAAGISLYRKRRQETETRMRHTRENLERLEDLRQELDKQLERLKRQSESAAKYKLYKAEHDKLDAELTVLRWKALETQLQERELNIKTIATSLEGKQAERTKLELDIEKIRLIITEKTDALKIVQTQFYEIGTQVARVEQTLEHHRERQFALQNDLSEINETISHTLEEIEYERRRYEELKQELETLKPEYENAKDTAANCEAVFLDADKAMREWTERFELFQEEASAPEKTAEVEKTKIEQIEKQTREALMRIDRLDKEMQHYKPSEQAEKVQQLEEAFNTQQNASNQFSSEIKQVTDNLSEAREQLLTETKSLDEAKKQWQKAEGRLSSLTALQEAALGKTNKTIQGWLEKNGLINLPRLAEDINVESGYERAAETVLKGSLEAICVDNIDGLSSLLPSFSEGQMSLFETHSQNAVHNSKSNDDKNSTISLPKLVHKIQSKKPLNTLIDNIFVADELVEALRIRKDLNSSESVVTKEGIWIGPNWLRFNKGDNSQLGVFEREKELKEIHLNIQMLSDMIQKTEEKTTHLRSQIKTLEAERDTLHKNEQQHLHQLRDLSNKVTSERSRLENIKQRIHHLEQEKTEQEMSMHKNEEEISLARLTLQTALDDMAEARTKKEALQKERETLRHILQKASEESRHAKEKSHILAIEHQKKTSEFAATEVSLKRLRENQEKLNERAKNLQTQFDSLIEPTEEAQFNLDDLLNQRVDVEEKLNSARGQVDEVQQNQNQLEKQRHHLEQEANAIRNDLEQMRLDWQTLEVRKQTVQEKLTAINANLQEILTSLSDKAEEEVWAEQLEQVAKRIERLGAINLTAIEEFETESERKNYLDAQHKDLTEALETLENAIRKIDKETRTRFKETFDKVNTEFQALFPRLFGGGQAYLELQGEDLLECGVTVMARPPGKRNSSIHLLSGGEKALTAVSLVFAIFQLNPAPFCLLDEVDAPLDDANVGRFCELVKHMSQTVQFIYITHNKLAMDMAHHLVGVTMKEHGVSRLVSVDIDEACELAVG